MVPTVPQHIRLASPASKQKEQGMTDLERELRISRSYHRLIQSRNYAERVRWLRAMELDIGMRSPVQVARMERKRGLAL